MINYRKFIKGTQIKPKTTTESDSQGDMEVLSSDGKLKYHNGTSNSSVVTEAHSATLTNKTIDADTNTITNIDNADIKSGAAIDRNKLASGSSNRVVVNDGSGVLSDATAITANRALASDANGIPVHSSVTDTELGYVSGVTSAIQTQIDGKQASGNYITDLSGDVIANGPGAVSATIQPNAIVDSKVSSSAAIARSKLASGTASHVLINDGSGVMISEAQLSISRGGTGQSTQTAAFNALSPNTTKGDIISHNGTNNVRVAAGTNGYVLTADSTQTAGVRWAPASGGGGGGGGSGIEQLLQKAELEKSGLYSEPLDNSTYTSGTPKIIDSIVGRLLKDTASGVNVLEMTWNPIFVNDSDKDMDSTTNWSIQNDASNLALNNATKQIGSDSLSFDKAGSSALASIRYDRGSQDLSLSSNTEMFFYIYLPSLTNFVNVFARIYKDSTSNYRTYTKTVDVSNSALTTGWNLIKIDLLNDSGTNTGTGWSTVDLSRYIEIGLEATSGQTYSGILVDSLMFSINNPNMLGLNGQEITLYNNSVKESVILDAANTRYVGRLTLAANTSNSYTGGSASSAAGLQRQTTLTSNYLVGFDSSLSSGAISTSQEFRMSRKLRDTVTGDVTLVVDVETPQFATVVSVGGSSVDIDDNGDLSANYANGDTVDVIRPIYTDGETSYRFIDSKTLSSGSSHSSGLTTLNLDVTDIEINDIVVKRSLTSSVSIVGENVNESFTGANFAASPNGIQVLDNYLGYPYRENLVGHFTLGGSTGANNIAPNPVLPLQLNGTLNNNENFLYGKHATSGWSSSNYYLIPSSYATYFWGTQRLSMSFWFYGTAFTGAFRNFCNFFFAPISGFTVAMDSGTNNVALSSEGQITYVPYNVGKWNHVLVNIYDGNCYIYVNGVKSGVNTNAISNNNLNFVFGTNASGSGSPLASSDMVSDLLFWFNNPEFTQAQAQSIYNGGNYKPFNVQSVRYNYLNTALSGQKISAKVQLDRTTTAVNPFITKAGLIVV